MGENSTTPITNSKTSRDNVTLKVVKRKGKVTNFLIDTSQDFIDTAAYEMENHIQAHVIDLIYYLVWGNKDSNTYEYDGLEKLITSQKNAFSTVSGGAVPSNLTFMDDMIDASNRKGGARHSRAWLMSPEMLSKVSQLLTNVRLNQGLQGSGITQVDINGGWRLNAYRDIPIIETSSLSPIEAMSPTVTVTKVATGGDMSNSTLYVYVSPITQDGEQAPCAEKTVTLDAGTAVQRFKIDLDDVHKTTINGTAVATAYAYKIYVGTATGVANCTLKKIVPAFTYDADGTPNGDNGVDSSIYVSTLTPGSDVPSAMQSDIPLVASGGVYPESVVLWDLDPIQGLGKLPFTNKPGDRYKGLVVTKPLAEIDDFINFLVKSYLALCPSFEGSSYWLRNIRKK